jgi:uncharacterized pyridoxamine 5'-phosphate oxidase family protein
MTSENKKIYPLVRSPKTCFKDVKENPELYPPKYGTFFVIEPKVKPKTPSESKSPTWNFWK